MILRKKEFDLKILLLLLAVFLIGYGIGYTYGFKSAIDAGIHALTNYDMTDIIKGLERWYGYNS